MRALIILLISLGCQLAVAADITELRVWHAPDQTRLIFDLSAATRFEVFTVANPQRVVIDLEQAQSTHRLKLPPEVSNRIQRLRYAAHGKAGTRVVLDLNHAAEVRNVLLPPRAPYGHRLVIDVIDPPELAHARTPPAPPAAPRVAPQTPPTVSPPGTTPTLPVATDSTNLPAWRRDGVVIAIDAGHGGDDVGAIGARGTYEKTVVLAIAHELATLINREPGMRAVLTRDGDYYVGLRERMERARKHQADMFVSIHADAFRDRRVRGSSVFVISRRGATSEAARWLAERENAADLVGGVTLEDKDPQLRSVLLDLSQTASLEASLDVAGAVLGSLRKVGELHAQGVQQAGFMVLKSPDIPSLLVETAFISNPQEEQRLRNHRFRVKLATAIRDGITQYFDQAAPPRQRMARSEVAQSAGQRHKHRVSRGETLSEIALHYSVSPDDIRLANSMDDDTVRSGELLRIP